MNIKMVLIISVWSIAMCFLTDVVIRLSRGVSRGSVLAWSLLFCLYINDLKVDLQICVHSLGTIPSNCSLGINILSESARIVAVWAKSNSLTLNSKKTKAIVFGTTHTLRIFKELQITKITINDTGDQKEFVDEGLSLGVILGSMLS